MLKADDLYVFPVDKWIATGVQWIALHLRPAFQAVKWPVDALLAFDDRALHAIPFPILILGAFLVLWTLTGWRTAIFSVLTLIVIAGLGVWSEAMTTLSLITTALLICLVVGLPLGVWCARSDLAWRLLRPVLDVMQTTPSFVYLVPVVMLFGVGTVPGEVAIVIAAAPPLIRFTNLGLRQVETELVEAGQAFGANDLQLLWEVQLPLAVPSILGGLNQTVLTAMVMSVVVAMIGAEGLGLVVLDGIGRLDVGQAAVGGIAIVLLAMMLDRITQRLAEPGRGAALPRALLQVLRGAGQAPLAQAQAQ